MVGILQSDYYLEVVLMFEIKTKKRWLKAVKKVCDSLFVLALMIPMVISLMPAGAAFVAGDNFGEGEVPIPPEYLDYYTIDTVEHSAALPNLKPGQVWVGKDAKLEDETSGLFTITLKAWGEKYSHVENGVTEPTLSWPLADLDERLIVTDVIGEQFELTQESLNYLNGLANITYDQSNSTVDWSVSQQAFVADEPVFISFNVQLKEGWETGIAYETNSSAKAEFKPRKGNPYYWMLQEPLPVYYTVSAVKWNSGVEHGVKHGRIQALTLVDADSNNPFKLVFDAGGGYKDGDTFTTTYNNETYNVIVNVDSNSPLYGGVTYVYKFSLTVFDFPEIGVNTVYDVYVDNEGGNTTEEKKYLKTIIYDDFRQIDDFIWINNGSTVRDAVEGTGIIEITLKPEPTPSPKPSTEPSPTPSTKPSAEPSPKPSTEPPTEPSPEPPTEPSPDPSTEPSAEPSTEPSPPPSPSSTPTNSSGNNKSTPKPIEPLSTPAPIQPPAEDIPTIISEVIPEDIPEDAPVPAGQAETVNTPDTIKEEPVVDEESDVEEEIIKDVKPPSGSARMPKTGQSDIITAHLCLAMAGALMGLYIILGIKDKKIFRYSKAAAPANHMGLSETTQPAACFTQNVVNLNAGTVKRQHNTTPRASPDKHRAAWLPYG
jgi:hypothetical protein